MYIRSKRTRRPDPILVLAAVVGVGAIVTLVLPYF